VPAGRKVLLALAANVAGAALGYGALLVVGRTFEPASYGSYVFATGVGGMFGLATTLGLGVAHQRFVAQGRPPDLVAGVAGRLRLLLFVAGAAVLAMAVGAYSWLRGGFLTDATTPQVLAGALAIQALSMSRMVYAETWGGQQRVGRVESLKLLDSAVFLVLLGSVGLMAAHLAGRWTPVPGVGAWWAHALGLHAPLSQAQAALALVACSAAGKATAFAVSTAWAVRDGLGLGPWDKALAREMWRFALPLGFTGAIGLVVAYTDVLVLGYFWTAREVGLYGTAQKLAVLAGLAPAAAASVLYPRFAQLVARGDAGKEARTFSEAERWVLAAVALVCAGFVALARPALHVAVGDAYLGADDALAWLAAATLVGALQMPLQARFIGHGRSRLLLQVGALNAAVNVALNLWLVPAGGWGLGWGIVGASVATLLSNALAYAVLRRQARRDFGTPVATRAQVAILLAAGAVAASLALAHAAQPLWFARAWQMAAWGAAAAAAYAGLLAALRAITAADVAWLRDLVHPGELWRELRAR
jgi:O-antigen/teichoic acid export membrane protein